jgi:hypothetical protein
VAAIKQAIKADNEVTSKEIEAQLVSRFGRRFSNCDRQIRAIRRKLGAKPVKGIGQDVLNPEQQQKRLAFCKKHKWDQFSNVIFTDEKPWELGKRRRVKWRLPGDEPTTVVKHKYTPTLQCWGGVSFKGKTPLRIW